MNTDEATHRHKVRNIVHSIVLIGGMAGIAWFCLTLIWGAQIAIWMLAFTGILLVFSPSLPVKLILSLYNAKALTPEEFPYGVRIVEGLARKAELPATPQLYYIPSSLPNAFTVGAKKQAAIAVSDGILHLLDRRELTGVLAHEIGHIANRDLWIMGLADVMSRVTMVSSYIGQFILLLNLPLILSGTAHIPWTAALLLVFSPTIMSLLQLALSRAREFDADLFAVRLTGDPAGLINALGKLERQTGRFWEEIVMPGRRIPDPSLLRTHPRTEDRIQRLLELAAATIEKTTGPQESQRGLRNFATDTSAPRWHRTGVWY